MATHDDVRRIASKLPGATESAEGPFGYYVTHKGKAKGFLWTWMERVDPKKARVPNPGVLAIVVRDNDIKQILLGGDEKKIFTEPHYNGFPAVLVRLDAIDDETLEDLVVEAWRCKAPAGLVAEFDARNGPS
ncbi:MAG TPA: hypothetical protein VGE01_09130 [Fimbriimonas sp.]